MKVFFFVDDDDLIIKSFKRIFHLYKDNYEAHFFNNAQDALEALFLNQPDYLFSDLHMPGIDGIQLIEQSLKISPHITTILISGDGFKQNEDKPAHFYLEKPCTRDQLIEIMQHEERL